MKLTEVGALLVLNAELDRYATEGKQSPERAVAWHAVLEHGAPGMTFEEARQLIITYYVTAGESLTPYALVSAWKDLHRLKPSQIAADVRSAKNRGLLPKSWPKGEPLPADVAVALGRVRRAEQERMDREIEAGGRDALER